MGLFLIGAVSFSREQKKKRHGRKNNLVGLDHVLCLCEDIPSFCVSVSLKCTHPGYERDTISSQLFKKEELTIVQYPFYGIDD